MKKKTKKVARNTQTLSETLLANEMLFDRIERHIRSLRWEVYALADTVVRIL